MSSAPDMPLLLSGGKRSTGCRVQLQLNKIDAVSARPAAQGDRYS